MAKKSGKQEDVIVDVEHAYSRTEEFVNKNRKPIMVTFLIIAAVCAFYFGYKTLILEPEEQEAKALMFQAENYFRKDSLQKAVYGDGINAGFMEVVDDYGSTKSGNLAHYYLGISFLKLGQWQEAISHLEEFSSDDVMLKPISIGAAGDAYMEMGDVDEAISRYEKAANASVNDFTTPIYLMKAGQAYEGVEKYDKALELYTRIKKDFRESNEARTIDKYIARAEGRLG